MDNKAYMKLRRKEHPELMVAYRKKHKVKIRLQTKEWRKRHPESVARTNKGCYERNKTVRLAGNKAYYEKNKEKVLLQQVEYHLKHRVHLSQLEKQYRIKKRDYIRSYLKQYFKDNRVLFKAYSHKRRTLDKIAGKLLKVTIQRVYEDNIKRYGTLTCVLCLKPILFGQDSLEHLIPVSRGGTNEYNNLAVAHRKCNTSKGNKTLEEFKIIKLLVKAEKQ